MNSLRVSDAGKSERMGGSSQHVAGRPCRVERAALCTIDEGLNRRKRAMRLLAARPYRDLDRMAQRRLRFCGHHQQSGHRLRLVACRPARRQRPGTARPLAAFYRLGGRRLLDELH